MILPREIEWPHIPYVMRLAEQTLKYQAAPIDQVLAVLETAMVSLRVKIEQHMMGDWDAKTIIEFGNLLTELDTKLELAGDAIILHENMENGVGHLWPVFALMFTIWNKLIAVGAVTVEQ